MSRENFIKDTIRFCEILGNGYHPAWDDYGYADIKLSDVKEELKKDYYQKLELDTFVLKYIDKYPNITGLKYVTQKGGMDEGSEYYIIWKIEHPDFGEILLKHEGWYASHHGSELENVFEVVPKQKMVTEYVTK